MKFDDYNFKNLETIYGVSLSDKVKMAMQPLLEYVKNHADAKVGTPTWDMLTSIETILNEFILLEIQKQSMCNTYTLYNAQSLHAYSNLEVNTQGKEILDLFEIHKEPDRVHTIIQRTESLKADELETEYYGVEYKDSPDEPEYTAISLLFNKNKNKNSWSCLVIIGTTLAYFIKEVTPAFINDIKNLTIKDIPFAETEYCLANDGVPDDNVSLRNLYPY